MATLLSLSLPITSTPGVTGFPRLCSSFKGNVRTLKATPCQVPCLRFRKLKPNSRTPFTVFNLASEPAKTDSPRFRLNNLGPQPGSTKNRKRKGRGHAAGQGGSCGFGMRGQKSRSGPGVRKGFEGGQMPLYRRLPKLKGIAGGMRAGLPKYVPVNLRDIEAAGFHEGEVVSLESLNEKGIINPSGREKRLPLKILGDGELGLKLTFKAQAFSASAKQKLEAAGCSLMVLPGRKKWVKPSVAKNLARAEEYFAKKRAAAQSVDSSSV